jgi:FKBP-type peptidyl-prolyl cis-trans isomerase FklB
MKILTLAAVSAIVLGCGQQAGAGNAKLTTVEDSVSYILGFKMGENLKQQSVPVNPAIIYQGMTQGFSGAKAIMADTTMQAVMMGFQVRMMGIQRQKDSVAGTENEKEGAAFLAANKSKEGVKTTPSGIQYKVIKEGTGPRPKPTSTVTVKYTGKLLNGEVFDASDRHGGTATFRLDQVIPGWTEAVGLMNTGSTYQFWIPGNLGYGPQGNPPNIGPNATLDFVIELMEVK